MEEGNTFYHMTFENTLSHPFFNQAEVLKADVLDLAEEFGRVFEPHKQLEPSPYEEEMNMEKSIYKVAN